MAIITPDELVSYLRDPEATVENVTLVAGLANGLVGDELESVSEPHPTWVKILTLAVAERGWQKFTEESVDDWAGKRAIAGAMALTDDETLRLRKLDGRGVESTAYTVQMFSPLDVIP